MIGFYKDFLRHKAGAAMVIAAPVGWVSMFLRQGALHHGVQLLLCVIFFLILKKRGVLDGGEAKLPEPKPDAGEAV